MLFEVTWVFANKTVVAFSCDKLNFELTNWKSQICINFEQVKMFYDGSSYQLIVTVLGASELPARDNGLNRNPYCKMYLLPDRRLGKLVLYKLKKTV